MEGKSPEIQKTEKQSLYPSSKDAMTQISELAPGLVGKLGEAYGGEMVAGQDPMQKAAYQQFLQYMQGGGSAGYQNNPLYSQSKGLMSDVLGGKYLGQNTPMMQYLNQKMYGEQVPTAMDELSRRLGIRGNFYSSAGIGQEGDIMENANTTMMGLYGQQYQNELNRQMGMIPTGMQTAQNEANAPLNDINMMNQMGAYQQQQQQTQDTAAQNEWLRQRQEQMMPLQMAPQMSQMYPEYDYSMTQGEASPFSKWISPALQGAALVAAPFTGGASLMAIPALQGINSATATQGTNPGGFANFMNAFAPMASMGMGSMGNYGQGANWMTGYGSGTPQGTQNMGSYSMLPKNFYGG